MLLGSPRTWHQHLGDFQTAWHFTAHGQPIGKTGRKNRERKATQGEGMIYVNISIPVPTGPASPMVQSSMLSENKNKYVSNPHPRRTSRHPASQTDERRSSRSAYFPSVTFFSKCRPCFCIRFQTVMRLTPKIWAAPDLFPSAACKA